MVEPEFRIVKVQDVRLPFEIHSNVQNPASSKMTGKQNYYIAAFKTRAAAEKYIADHVRYRAALAAMKR